LIIIISTSRLSAGVEKKPLATFALGILLATVMVSALFMTRQGGSNEMPALSSNPPSALEKIKVSLLSLADSTVLIRELGKDTGIYAKNGLDPDFSPATRPIDY